MGRSWMPMLRAQFPMEMRTIGIFGGVLQGCLSTAGALGSYLFGIGVLPTPAFPYYGIILGLPNILAALLCALVVNFANADLVRFTTLVQGATALLNVGVGITLVVYLYTPLFVGTVPMGYGFAAFLLTLQLVLSVLTAWAVWRVAQQQRGRGGGGDVTDTVRVRYRSEMHTVGLLGGLFSGALALLVIFYGPLLGLSFLWSTSVPSGTLFQLLSLLCSFLCFAVMHRTTPGLVALTFGLHAVAAMMHAVLLVMAAVFIYLFGNVLTLSAAMVLALVVPTLEGILAVLTTAALWDLHQGLRR